MKIIHVVESLERGGLERIVVDLVRAQGQAGHDVQVVCLFERGLLARELDVQGIPVHACGKRRGHTLAALTRLRVRLRAAATGVLHTHNAAAHYHAMVAGAGIPFACVVNTRHGMGVSDPRSRREWLYRRSLWRTDAVAAVCEAACDRFRSQGVAPRGQLLAVPNGIDVAAFETVSLERHGALAELLGVARTTPIIGTVGRLTPVKDQALLLKAFADVLAQLPDAVLVLVGDGPLRAELEGIANALGIADRVRFLGDRSDVGALLAGFDLFVLPSRSEGYSIALLEACAAGLAIVATDVGGNGEIVRDGRNGRLVPAADAAALAQAIVDLPRDPATSRAMGWQGRKWAEAEASLEAMVARYQALYAMTA